MDRIYRVLLTFSLVLGLQIHLPVTMFPASEVVPLNEENVHQKYNFLQYNLELLQNKPVVREHQNTRSVNTNHEDIYFKTYQSKPNLQSFNPLKTTVTIKQDSLIGLDNERLDRIHTNSVQTVVHPKHQTVGGLSGSDPRVSASQSEEIYGTTPFKKNFLSDQLQRTFERLVNISNAIRKKKQNKEAESEAHAIELDKHQRSNVNKIGDSVGETNGYNRTFTNEFTAGSHKITWPSNLVRQCPEAYSESDQKSWKYKVQTYEIIKIEEGCGSMQNRLVTFNDSTKACVRYRLNADLMQGEIYSYYLSKLLNMGYTVPTTLHKVENTEQWAKVQNEVFIAKWSDFKPLIFTQWVDNLVPVFLPPELKPHGVGLHSDIDLFKDKTVPELCDLVQWSDLVVFDYMSANLDRVVNNMFNLKWNDQMMDKPIHNLEKSGENGAFVFLDNESGLFHGYRLLDTYDEFHRKLLKSICLFTPATIEKVEELYKEGNIGQRLIELFVSGEIYQNMLPRMSAKTIHILEGRLEYIYKHMQSCRHLNSDQAILESPRNSL